MKLIHWMIYWTAYSVSWIKWTLGIRPKTMTPQDGTCGITLVEPDGDIEPLTLDTLGDHHDGSD
jgi:hypothetical protein